MPARSVQTVKCNQGETARTNARYFVFVNELPVRFLIWTLKKGVTIIFVAPFFLSANPSFCLHN